MNANIMRKKTRIERLENLPFYTVAKLLNNVQKNRFRKKYAELFVDEKSLNSDDYQLLSKLKTLYINKLIKLTDR